MYFKASLDKLSIILTLFIVCLFIGITFLPFFIEAIGDPNIPMLTSIIIWVAFIYCYLYRVTGYKIKDSILVIERPFKDKILSKENISEIKRLSEDDLKGTIRIFGNAGLFGYFGKFANKKLGNMTWYTTKRSDLVLIVYKNKKLIVSPDNTEAFLNAVKK